jgi:hypothetical protein
MTFPLYVPVVEEADLHLGCSKDAMTADSLMYKQLPVLLPETFENPARLGDILDGDLVK